MASTAKDFDEVFEEELHEIRQRREVCRLQAEQAADQGTSGSETPPSDEEIEARLREELAGLALSGGGVRSAAFNLGLLQALYQSGRMQDVDYLSTVSGGGYAGALFSASVANDKDGVNWSRESRFNRLPIEPRPDGSQPPRVYELALHGRAMSRPLQWLSRHLWGWILTILFVISGVIAIASILAWLMRIVWSHENLLTVQAQGFATDLHIAFYPAFLALLFWAFCNLASVIMRAVNVRIPPISRFAYVLLIVTIVLGMVSFSAIGDFDMSDYVSAQIVPPHWSAVVTRFLHHLSAIALGLLSLCLLPLLTPHKLLESGRNRQKPLYRLAFNIAGFAIICGVPLAVFYLLSRENVSSYNFQRPGSDMMTQSHLSELEKFIPYLAAHKSLESESKPNLRERITSKLDAAIGASGENEKYPLKRKEVVDDQSEGSFPGRLLQYMAYRLGLHEEFEERVERRRDAASSKGNIAKYINSDVLTHPFLFEPRQGESAAAQDDSQPLGFAYPGAPNSTNAEGSNGDLSTTRESVVTGNIGSDIVEKLHLAKTTDPGERERLELMIEEIRAHNRVLLSQYGDLFNKSDWWKEVKRDLEEFRAEKRELDDATFRLVLAASVMDDIGGNANSARGSGAGSPGQQGRGWLVAELLSTGRQVLDIAARLTQGGVEVEPAKLPDEVRVARRLTSLQSLLKMESSGLVEKLDGKLELAFGKDRKTADFLANFKRLHEAEKLHVDSHLQPIRTSNWAVLSAMYPDYVKERKTVYAWNVNAADQAFRLRIIGYSTLVFLFVGLLANLNRMCLHGVYRDQLAAVWLPTGPFMLKDLDTCRNGGPLHLFNATLNRHGKQLDPDAEGMSRFVLSNRFCGSKRFGYRETWEYENGEMGLADAVAISGAAVSTSYAGDLLFRTLLFLTNFRLGQWVRNPKHFHEEHYWPSPLRILISYLWHPTDRAYVDLTDGGHLDNTGLSSLLERRCRVMIVGDCSDDEEYRFESLFAVLQAARAKYGIQIDEFQDNGSMSDNETPTEARSIDALGRLIPDESKHYESQSHFAVFRLRYPEKRSGVRLNDGDTCADTYRSAVLIVVKPTLTGDEPADLLARRRVNVGFPNDSTVNQFLDPEQFESYVMLGRHIGEQLDQFILDGKLDRYHLPAPWCSTRQNAETTEDASEQPAFPEAEQDQEMPANAAAGAGERVADRVTLDESEQPSVSSELPGPSAVAQLLNPLRFDKPGIGVAIALVRQWAEAEYENDQELLSASSDVFDHIIRPVSKWAYEEGAHRPLALRRLFCSQLIEILKEHTWIANEADEEIRNDFRNMLEGVGDGVAAASSAIVSLSPDSEQVS